MFARVLGRLGPRGGGPCASRGAGARPGWSSLWLRALPGGAELALLSLWTVVGSASHPGCPTPAWASGPGGRGESHLPQGAQGETVPYPGLSQRLVWKTGLTLPGECVKGVGWPCACHAHIQGRCEGRSWWKARPGRLEGGA